MHLKEPPPREGLHVEIHTVPPVCLHEYHVFGTLDHVVACVKLIVVTVILLVNVCSQHHAACLAHCSLRTLILLSHDIAYYRVSDFIDEDD